MHQEIERKFLVKGEFKSQADSKTHIEQGYFATEPGKTVRVRIRDDKGYLTIKGPSSKDGLARYEFETEISLEDAREMMKLCMPGRVDKNRYLIRAGKHTIEVDEFFGDNEGLVMAEIELETSTIIISTCCVVLTSCGRMRWSLRNRKIHQKDYEDTAIYFDMDCDADDCGAEHHPHSRGGSAGGCATD